MNFLSVTLYNYINIALSVGLIALAVIYRSENTQLFIAIFPILIIALNSFLISKKSNPSENTLKNVVLVTFISSVLLSFAPYILQYTSNKSLFFSSLIFTILILLNTFVVKLNNEEEK
jgi:hypothetical protein